MDYRHTIHFSLDQARELLPEVIPIVESIRDAKFSLDELGYDIRGHHFFAGMGTNGTKPYPEDVDNLIAHFRDLTARGVVIKDMDRGLIDFPALRDDGEEVYLCFMLGEKTINYWHGLEEGYVGRQPVETL